MSEVSSKRLLFIDIARTYAVILALLSHAFVSTGYFDQIGPNAILIRQFTRMATPMFVFMFGFMVEFIYVRKYEIEGFNSINKRILSRSFQCYVAYALTSFSALLGGYKSLEGFFASLFFFSDSRFGNILRTYSMMLLITPFIIKLRVRFGLKFLIGSLILLISCYSFIHYFSSLDLGIFNHHFNFLFGIGLQRGGPSVLGALSFFIAGMICASSLKSYKSQLDPNMFNFHYTSLLLITILSILGFLLIKEDFRDMWVLFSDGIYRKNNTPEYYIIGIVGSLLTITLFYFIVGSRTPSKKIKFILPIGTSSLISYTTGNLILNLFNVKTNDMNVFVFVFLFFTAVILVTTHINKVPYYKEVSNVMNLKLR